MSRAQILNAAVTPLAERLARIAAEALPPNLGALLDEAAAAAPHAVAWNFFESGEIATFAEVRAAVNRLAAGLAEAGIGKGSHVGVMLPNIAGFPLTWLALARLGAVMVPMNIAYTPREMSYVVNDGDVAWLVIHADYLANLAAMPERPQLLASERVIVFGDPGPGQRRWADAAAHDAKDFTPAAEPALDDVLNIQYTSGTTGFPKGCMLTQRYWLTIGKVNAFRDGRDYRRILAATPFFYMDPQWLLAMAFYRRATLFVARRQSTSRFMAWVREHGIEFTLFPEAILKQPVAPEDARNALIRMNCYGLRKESQAEAEARYDCIIREAYGMTEIGSGLFMPIEAADMVGSGSCGVVAPFREARIADQAGNPVAPGGTGELLICGPGILRGYYNKPEATAAAFHGDWFRTGDLFRQDARGYYFIVGRVKDMIRRAGENIAAREVEAVLRGLPEIAEAAAVPVPDETRKEEVKVYLVLQPGLAPRDLPLERVIAHCEANLAKFKVPRYYEFRGSLPKTPSEKIAKGELVKEKPDLRAGSYDRVDGVWR